MGLVDDLCLIFVAALIGGLIARAARMPLVLGYILAGLFVSPHTPGPKVLEIKDIEHLAEMGVALLMFGIGLEFSLSRLSELKRVALLGTCLQMLACLLGGMLMLHLFGYGWLEGLWFGAALSLSSTMVALKVLDAQGFREALSGRVMLAMLVVQDLAIIPMMLLLPEVANLSAGMASVARLAVTGTGMVLVVWFVGGRLLPRIFGFVASHSPRELFTLLVVTVGLGVGFLSYLAGLSFAFGAFLAGLVLAESDYTHHVLSELGPLRDLFGMLFFVSVGLLIEPRVVSENLPLLLGLLVGTFLLKCLVFAGVVRLFGFRRVVPWAVGLTLWQIGEFSFVLAQVGVKAGAVSSSLYNLVMVTAVFSMVLTPATSYQAGRVHAWWKRHFSGQPEEESVSSGPPQSSHVLIGGYGRVGFVLARALAAAGIDFCAVDPRPEVLSRARQFNHRVVLGDLSSETILDACGAYRARLAVLTMPDPLASTRVAEILHQARPDLTVLARGVSQEHCRDLREHGVRMALWPEFECGLELTKQGLLSLGLPADEDVLRTELENDGFGRKDAPLHFEDTLPMDEREQLVTALIQLAWADGRWSPAETSLVRQILDRVGLSHQEFEQRVIRYRDGSRPKLELLDKGRRMNAMRLLLAVAWSDQQVPEPEARYLGDMARQLALTEAELQALLVETRGTNEEI
ncbi:MAG: hypothetical protein AMXMBFR33_68930 [Candidatus Xenobia bacterium]